ncbi:MAG: carbohydrate binding domain-containing protein [Pseudomonas sp.]
MQTRTKWLSGMLLAATLQPALANEQVDVLVLYTPEAANARTGQDIQARIVSYIEFSNQALRNSEVAMQLRLVGAQETTDSRFHMVGSTTLNYLRTDRTVNQLRQEYGADLVVLVNLPAPGGLCGMGYLPGGDPRTGRFYANSSAYGFSAVGVSCGYVTFPHELGHNMSLGHSHAQGEFGSVYSWGRGHGVAGSFATVMAYPQSYSVRNHLQFFSNPQLNRCNGMPCGSPSSRADGADAASALNLLAEQIANFMPTAVPGDNPGNGGGDLPLCEKPELQNQNLIADADFNDLSAWSSFMGLASLDRVTATTSCGRDYRLHVTGRRASYAGAIQTIQAGLQAGVEYRVSALMGLTGINQREAMRVSLELTDNAGTRYVSLPTLSVTSQELSRYDQTFRLDSDGAIQSARLLVSGPAANVDFLLDEVKLVRTAEVAPPTPSPTLLYEESFERTANGWSGYMGTLVYRTLRQASEGRYGLISSRRESTNSGPGFTATGFVVPGETYQLSLDVMLQDSRASTDTVELMAWYVDAEGAKWQRLSQDSLATGSWHRLSAEFELNNSGPVEQVRLHVMGPAAEAQIVIDEVQLRRR